MLLLHKKIILGITGSIAAYKAIFLLRLLTKQGAEVRVIMTKSALDFVSPLVLSTFSKHKVWIEFTDDNTWHNHVELAFWADVLVIAPASFNTIGKMANGICDNLLLATYFSARCPVVVVPAMDEDMYLHPAQQQSLEKLQQYGNKVMNVNSGELASGLIGWGRMQEPEEIIQYLKEKIFRGKVFEGKKVLITAGPTQEKIDPVRYISNYSTGKMGMCLAEEFFLNGADVTLIAGPLQVEQKVKGIETIAVQTASEMENACLKYVEQADIIIMAAAVADYRPVSESSEKIKKKDQAFHLELEKTNDILTTIGNKKRGDQVLIGFALETENEEMHALEKMQRKKADFMILNTLKQVGAGFGLDTNSVTIYSKSGSKHLIALNTKEIVAKEIIHYIFNQ